MPAGLALPITACYELDLLMRPSLLRGNLPASALRHSWCLRATLFAPVWVVNRTSLALRYTDTITNDDNPPVATAPLVWQQYEPGARSRSRL